MSNAKKLAVAALFVAIAVALSSFSIPVGAARAFPIQHMINILSAVMLGPIYGVLVAFVTAIIRVSIGTGTLLAFPGSMIGALLAALLYRKSESLYAAFLGEVIGTGIFGALAAYPVAALLMSREAALFAFIIPFSISSLVGAGLGLMGVSILKKKGILADKPIR